MTMNNSWPFSTIVKREAGESLEDATWSKPIQHQGQDQEEEGKDNWPVESTAIHSNLATTHWTSPKLEAVMPEWSNSSYTRTEASVANSQEEEDANNDFGIMKSSSVSTAEGRSIDNDDSAWGITNLPSASSPSLPAWKEAVHADPLWKARISSSEIATFVNDNGGLGEELPKEGWTAGAGINGDAWAAREVDAVPWREEREGPVSHQQTVGFNHAPPYSVTKLALIGLP